MSLRMITKALDADCGTGDAKAVLLVLASYADDAGGSCFPKIETIARQSNLSEQGARNQIARLEKRGLLKVQRSQGRTSNRYQLTPHAVEGCSSPSPSKSASPTPYAVEGQPPTPLRDTLHAVEGSTPHAVDPIRHDQPSDDPSVDQSLGNRLRRVEAPSVDEFFDFALRKGIVRVVDKSLDAGRCYTKWYAAGWKDGEGKSIENWQGLLVKLDKKSRGVLLPDKAVWPKLVELQKEVCRIDRLSLDLIDATLDEDAHKLEEEHGQPARTRLKDYINEQATLATQTPSGAA